MNFEQSFRLAIKSLLGNKMRSFLTMLGIIIGVAAVIILISLVDGFSKNLTTQLESFGTNLINVNIMGRNSNRSVSVDDIQALVDKNPEVLAAFAPSVSINSATVKNGNTNATTSVLGTNDSYTTVNNAPISAGRFLNYTDVANREKSAVIGQYVAQELYGGGSPLGQTIKINAEIFNIIGVLALKSNNQAGSQDDRVIIPYNVAARINRNASISTFSFSATTKDTVNAGLDVINAYLAKKFPTGANRTNTSYRVSNQADMLNQLNTMTGTLSLVLSGIAGISLLVGGIGIMNIMLVSVTERTKEIGIRKALGAKRSDILGQFVTEATTTSSVGGIIGIILGAGVSYLIGYFMKMSTDPSINSILLAFGVSASIGILFGYMPANKAARLNPIDALRYE